MQKGNKIQQNAASISHPKSESTTGDKYEPLLDQIKPYLESALVEIPDYLIKRLENSILIDFWDNLSIEQRCSVLEQIDAQENPELAQERQRCAEYAYLAPNDNFKSAGCNQFGYTIIGAALALSEKYKIPLDEMNGAIHDAVKDEELIVRRPRTGTPYKPRKIDICHDRIYTIDLNKWFETKKLPYQLDDANNAITSQSNAEPPSTAKPKRIKMRNQEAQILAWLKENGFNPKELPKVKNGKSGVKSEAHKALKNHDLFKDTVRVFDKAWERLLLEDIKNVE